MLIWGFHEICVWKPKFEVPSPIKTNPERYSSVSSKLLTEARTPSISTKASCSTFRKPPQSQDRFVSIEDFDAFGMDGLVLP
ncbi:MAG: hypothetical protein E5X88_16915 [Mesorhizobium sp.]|uniref:hypothetical protein n=1 Tax=Mesorhizobium sp. TaxID=1871066 RepID=UPI001201DD55|nr:hypothetical protein [Mesorhizobium sp.]TIO07736.1 MAG: hypothetical protein E5X88_16915 [Mesorhizobium sp.]TIP08684.1 MAG: hypothetical protein E5X73_30620 [Mesorhizobium sp.]